MALLVGTTAGAFSIGDETEQLVAGAHINHIARDRTGWWAVDGKGRILHNGDVTAEMPDGAAALCVQPTSDTTWVGSNDARLYGLDQDELSEDEFFADAPGRETWFTPWGAPADIRSMTLDADQTLYVNVHVGGILRYDDTGPVPTLDISADVHQVAAHPSQKGAVFAATAHGLAVSHNGHDFEFRSDGLHAPYCRAVAVMEDRVLVSASTGPRTSRGRLYACPLWEDAIEPVTAGLPEWFDENLDTHCISVDGPRAFVGHGDTLWLSDDHGVKWSVLTAGLPQITSIA